ncbi:MAG: hypothetical protein ACI3W5_11750 [Faecousia sp.]
MSNSYSYYFQVNAVIPLFHILVASAVLIFSVIPVLCTVIRSSEKRIQNIISILVVLPAVYVFIFVTGRPFFAGGYHLFFESENACVPQQGYVQEITECVNSEHRYRLDTGVTEGYNININQEIYHIMYLDNIQVGDHVYIEYLPKSKFILNIELLSN